MAIAVPLTEGAGPNLKQRLKHAERINRWKAQALIAPLALFLLLVFLVPIAALCTKASATPKWSPACLAPSKRCNSGMAKACRARTCTKR